MNKRSLLWPLASLLVLASMLLSACGAPATTAAPPPTEAPATQAPPPAATTAPTEAPVAAGPSCGTDPVVLNAYFETGFDIPFKLSEEFTKQYPNVTWDIKQDQFANLINETPRLLSGDNPPDLIRLPTVVSVALQGLLRGRDGCAAAFGGDKGPVPESDRKGVAEGGSGGSG